MMFITIAVPSRRNTPKLFARRKVKPPYYGLLLQHKIMQEKSNKRPQPYSNLVTHVVKRALGNRVADVVKTEQNLNQHNNNLLEIRDCFFLFFLPLEALPNAREKLKQGINCTMSRRPRPPASKCFTH